MVEGADVFFFPHVFLAALSPSCKRVTTFHDLSFLHFPEHLTLRKRIWHNLQMRLKWQAKFSDKIIAVSESTKNDLVHFYKVDPARIEVIYSGVKTSSLTSDVMRTSDVPLLTSNVGTTFAVVNSNNISSTSDVVSTSEVVNSPDVVINNIARPRDLRCSLPDRFILYLGKLEPRKNVLSLIKAFNNLKLKPKYKDVGLVIAGAKGWKCEDIFKEANIWTSNVPLTTPNVGTTFGVNNSSDVANNRIIFTGQLSDEERFLYYRAASIFIYPSFFEGFGFPPLEAMSCGTPVITSRTSSLPEVVGGAAVTIDPYDVKELELWITKLLDDKNLSDLMVKRGIEQASKFSWQDTAVRTLEVLTKA